VQDVDDGARRVLMDGFRGYEQRVFALAQNKGDVGGHVRAQQFVRV